MSSSRMAASWTSQLPHWLEMAAVCVRLTALKNKVVPRCWMEKSGNISLKVIFLLKINKPNNFQDWSSIDYSWQKHPELIETRSSDILPVPCFIVGIMFKDTSLFPSIERNNKQQTCTAINPIFGDNNNSTKLQKYPRTMPSTRCTVSSHHFIERVALSDEVWISCRCFQLPALGTSTTSRLLARNDVLLACFFSCIYLWNTKHHKIHIIYIYIYLYYKYMYIYYKYVFIHILFDISIYIYTYYIYIYISYIPKIQTWSATCESCRSAFTRLTPSLKPSSQVASLYQATTRVVPACQGGW